MKKILIPFLILFLSGCVKPFSTPLPEVESTPTVFSSPGQQNEVPTVSGDDPTQNRMDDSTGLQIYKIHMINQTMGWGLGFVGGEAPLVLITRDGGRNWQDTHVPIDKEIDPGSILMACFFMDEATAWAVPFSVSFPPSSSQSIWKTIDGGKTWQESRIETDGLLETFYISHLFFIDDSNGWLLAHVGAGMNHDYIAIYRTTDGGFSWDRILDPMTDESGIQSCQKNGLVFSDPDNGWLTGSCNGVAPGVLIFRTEDGGKTWEKVDLPPPDGFETSFQSFDTVCGSQFPEARPDRVLIEVACRQMSASLEQPLTYLYKSSDNGKTWSITSIPEGMVTYLPDDNLVILGSKTLLSRDLGKTWLQQETISDGIQSQFIDSDTGWILSSSGRTIYVTDDGGETWSDVLLQLAP